MSSIVDGRASIVAFDSVSGVRSSSGGIRERHNASSRAGQNIFSIRGMARGGDEL